MMGPMIKSAIIRRRLSAIPGSCKTVYALSLLTSCNAVLFRFHQVTGTVYRWLVGNPDTQFKFQHGTRLSR